MNYLVDTHYLLWSLFSPENIGDKVKGILTKPQSIKFVSQITFWEISLKYSLGKLELSGITPSQLLLETEKAGYVIQEMHSEDLASFWQLPVMAGHRDPFDRLLIWQCMRHKLTFVSADKRAKDYCQHGLLLAE
ncbi:MAG: PIN domain nuclease [Candidatus Riflebacteria bacterium HGW-Riflebacteria-1]|jgi:PIN domain nuclease of toxin-antitoxin system|nr:MAG: PIN domain nuclease [Candidatus Riflebacteria bacterium HGW-Riflebacteria-1]